MNHTRPSTSSIRSAVALLAALGAAAAVPAHAHAAVAKLEVPSGSSMKASPVAQIGFHLSSGWKLVHGEMENTPSIGSYSRAHDLGHGASCVLRLDAVGVALRAADAPRFDGRRLHVRSPRAWQAGPVSRRARRLHRLHAQAPRADPAQRAADDARRAQSMKR